MGRRTLAGLLAGTLLATLAACGSPKPGTFHPEGTALSGNTFLPASPAAGSGGLTWPPFGSDVHIVMPSWLPGSGREKQAVITAKDFLLAFLYAEYKGSRDQRWTSYVSGGGVLDGLKSNPRRAGHHHPVLPRNHPLLAHASLPRPVAQRRYRRVGML